jgi:hypothetical protein
VFFESHIPHILPHKDREFSVHLAVDLFSIGMFIVSYFSEKLRIKQTLENSSLILAAVFYRMLIGSDLIEGIPAWIQLLFLISFALFLYFKVLYYFNRNAEKEI